LVDRSRLERELMGLKGPATASRIRSPQKIGPPPQTRTETLPVKSGRFCHSKSQWIKLWSRYSPVSVEDEHSSEPATRLSSRSTSAQVLFAVAPVWSAFARMISLCGPISAFAERPYRSEIRSLTRALARPASSTAQC